MSALPQHPDLLPYVAGQVESGETADIAAHLQICPECRSEAEALRSMKRTLLERAGAGHERVEDLVLYDEGSLAGDPDRLASLERHLEACADCKADLGSLQAARLRQGAPEREASRAAGRTVRWRARLGWAFAAAALAAAALLPLARGLRPSVSRPPAGADAPVVTFAPPRRGDAGESRLAGHGPWSISVVLPFGASAGDYPWRIERADGSLVRSTDTPLASDGSTLRIQVEALPGGAYRLLVGPGPGLDAPYVYPFQVEGPGP